ncbi:MAG: hypothetical protein HY674_02895, partial [Chloroflexi bacterium]|nr:hypothetical protein [Chloroflexota bacterium]
MKWRVLKGSFLAACFAATAGLAGTASAVELKNTAFRVSVARSTDNVVVVEIDDRAGSRKVADGPYFFRAVKTDDKTKTYALENAT